MTAAPIIEEYPAEVQAALASFSTALRSALSGARETWARQLGLVKRTRFLQSTFPLPVTAPAFKRLVTGPRFRSLSHVELVLRLAEWQDGVEGKAREVNQGDWSGLRREPAAMATEAANLASRLIAERLEAGTSETTKWDGLPFFSNAHRVNPFLDSAGTFPNLLTGKRMNRQGVRAAKQAFRTLKAPNGLTSLGARLTHVIVPTAMEDEARRQFEGDLAVEEVLGPGGVLTVDGAALDNRYKGTANVIVADQLEADEDWYALSLNLKGLYPWVILEREAGVETSLLDKTSDLYKQHRRVAINSTLELEGALGMPHSIIKMAA